MATSLKLANTKSNSLAMTGNKLPSPVVKLIVVPVIAFVETLGCFSVERCETYQRTTERGGVFL